ncbi:hypothetical protein BDZ94DRAFT_534726 [Collybia nuda]|uniref:GST N-terminal domain-containing protein n=1 Tax=Collybia nuda TaxID=64659 RepID=A0A9P5YA25_9AGAR|nr:hypothetical protein BDZ94DRAFT_534726 [Collybia nuda]
MKVSNTIFFYDIPSTTPNMPWSPNTWKTRYCLNFKGFPYKTIWVECPNIELTCKTIGAPPTGKNPDGTPIYTLPAIYDPSTGAAIADSTDIALYLDAAYPNTPKLFPPGAYALLRGILDAHFQPPSISILRLVLPAIYDVLNPSSQVFFRRSKEKALRMEIKDMTPRGKHREEEWDKVMKQLDDLDERLPKVGGPFILGNEVSFLDFVVASHMLTTRDLLGEKSKEWDHLKLWNEGRWLNILKSVEKYESLLNN